jgi:hypothetical protein
MPPTGISLFKALNISLIKLYEASSVDESLLKPYIGDWIIYCCSLYGGAILQIKPFQ